MASDELAQKLILVIKEDYGEDISLESAHAMLNDAVGYFDVLANIYHKSVEAKDELGSQ